MEEKKEQFDARTLNDALDKASAKFGAPREQIDYRIVKQSMGGFFGLLGGKVVIEAWTKEQKTVPLEEKYGIQAPEKEAPPPAQAESKPPQAAAPAQAEAAAPCAGGGRREMERRDRGGRNWRGGRQERRDRPADEPVRPEGRLVSSEPVTIGPELETFLKIMFVFIGEDAEISVKEDAETATAGVTVQPDSIFSSREGHTIESLKTILDKMINKGPIIRKRVRLQVSEAAQKPDGEMAELGLELGRKALSIGKPVSVRGLPPQDRKAIHSALVNDGRLKTQSSGEGVFRRLYVVPKGARQEPRRPSRDDGLGEKGGNGGGSGRA